jgi:hypothetical protein
MREYTYKGAAGAMFGLAPLGGLILVIGAALLSVMILGVGIYTHADVSAVICWGGWMLVVCLIVGLGLMNAFPTVWVGEETLVISAFLFARIAIPWEDILDVKTEGMPFGSALVRAKRITLVHRLYGWLYSKSLRPSFFVGYQIDHYDELIAEIRLGIATHRGAHIG